MDEVGGALVSIALTLCAVFVPSAFLSGISGQFFRQFAVTIAASTVISCFVSLTLSPALCALLLKPHDPQQAARGSLAARLLAAGFGRFNRGFEWLSRGYGQLTRRLVRGLAVVVVVYVALIAAAGFEFARTPTGFIPEQDQGYLITVVQLPPGATLARTEQVVKQAVDIILKTPGVEHVAPFAGLDATTFTVARNSGTIFSGLPSLYNHEVPGGHGELGAGGSAQAPVGDRGRLRPDHSAAAGAGHRQFRRLQDDAGGPRGAGFAGAGRRGATRWSARPTRTRISPASSHCSTRGRRRSTPISTAMKAEKVGLTPTDVFSTLQVYLGSQYVNDFNLLGRTYQVIVQADGRFRRDRQDLTGLKARNAAGEMVPIGTVADLRTRRSPIACRATTSIPRPRCRASRRPASPPARHCTAWRSWRSRCCRPASASNGPRSPIQQEQKGTPTVLVFGAAALFVFLVLAAKYESWKVPLAVVLIVPMCLLASVSGLMFRGMPIDILAQIGFVVLVGLAAKNAILIVEFARQAQDDGSTPAEAAVHAARTRLRPILMTSLAFILGVAPLVVATGAGAEMRQSLGTAVFGGMLGVTAFGLIFTPAFYTLVQRISFVRNQAAAHLREPRTQGHKEGPAIEATQSQTGH